MKTTSTLELPPAIAGEFDELGFCVYPAVLSATDCDSLTEELTPLFSQQQSNSTSKIGGVRNLLRVSNLVARLANSPKLITLVNHAAGRSAFPVRAIFFDKTAESNWRVPWHQDLTIAVKERIAAPGFGPWSIKEGVAHVQPPLHILENMVAIRIHLDTCDETNGALRIIPGSHLEGELSAESIAALRIASTAITCNVPRGGALLMRPLLLHASSPATNPAHRRVVHIEYACDELANSLEWFDR